MWTETEYLAAFDASVGSTVAALTDTAEKDRWFNAGQARMQTFYRTSDSISWSAGNTEVAVPTDLRRVNKIVWDDGTYPQDWVLVGRSLIIYDPNGATEDGSATIYYDAEWPDLDASTDSLGNRLHDEACLSYALSRFFKKLSSDRGFYKRYATLVGANATSMSDLQDEADRHYNDFLDTRADETPDPPVSPYGGD